MAARGARAGVVATTLAVVACATPAPAPITAPSNQPAVDARAPSGGPVEPGSAIGPIALGMTEAELRAALGQPDRAERIFLDYYRLGLGIRLHHGRVAAVHAFRGISTGSEAPWRAFAIRLPHGLGWDATEDQVWAAFGRPTQFGRNGADETWLTYPGVSFLFLDDGRLAAVSVEAEDE